MLSDGAIVAIAGGATALFGTVGTVLIAKINRVHQIVNSSATAKDNAILALNESNAIMKDTIQQLRAALKERQEAVIKLEAANVTIHTDAVIQALRKDVAMAERAPAVSRVDVVSDAPPDLLTAVTEQGVPVVVQRDPKSIPVEVVNPEGATLKVTEEKP